MNERLHRVKKALHKTDKEMGILMGYSGASGFNNLLHGDKKIPLAKLSLLEKAGINIHFLNGESEDIFKINMEAEPHGTAERVSTNQTILTMDGLEDFRRGIEHREKEINRLWQMIDVLNEDKRRLFDIISGLGELKILLSRRQ